MADPAPRIRFQSDEWERVQRAAEVADFDDPKEFVQEGALRFVDETIDEDGQLECPHEDCDRTFATIRQRRGHLGNVHTDVFPEGDYWCGYCGYGPSKFQGINAHHSQRHSKQGDPVRLDHDPDRDELLAPDDIPDHQDPMLLERLYREHDGNYTAMCRDHDFEVTSGRVRHYLIEFDIHKPTPQGDTEDGDGPLYRNCEWLKERYEAAGGNISEMHRNLEIDVPYRTLVKNIKRFDFHDPTDPPGKRHGKGGPKPSTEAEPEPKSDDQEDDEDQDDTTEADETETAEADDVGTDRVDEAVQDKPAAEPEPEPENPQAQLGVDDPAAGESFHNLDTPDWLDEASFYQAVDMADDVKKLGECLGWEKYDRLKRMVELLGVDERLNDCLADRRNMEADST